MHNVIKQKMDNQLVPLIYLFQLMYTFSLNKFIKIKLNA
jgi:hypothetical protein